MFARPLSASQRHNARNHTYPGDNISSAPYPLRLNFVRSAHFERGRKRERALLEEGEKLFA